MSTYISGSKVNKRHRNKQNVYTIGLVIDNPKRVKVVAKFSNRKMCLILLNCG